MPDDNNSVIWISHRAEFISALKLPVDASDAQIVAAITRDDEWYRAAMIVLEVIARIEREGGELPGADAFGLFGITLAINVGIDLSKTAEKLGPCSAHAVTWPLRALSAKTPDDLRKLQHDVAKTVDALSEQMKEAGYSSLREIVPPATALRDSLAALTNLL